MEVRRIPSIFICVGVVVSFRAHAQPVAASPKDFFSHPELLCTALQPNGIVTGPWKQLGSGYFNEQIEALRSPYSCEYPIWVHRELVSGQTPHLPGTDTTPPPVPDTTLVYRVSGDTGKRADTISIAVTVHRPEAIEAGEQELEREVIQLFKSIDRREPAGLFASMRSHRYFLSRQLYGIVWFNLVIPDHHKITDQTLWFRLRE